MTLFPNKRVILNLTTTLAIMLTFFCINITPTPAHAAPSKQKVTYGANQPDTNFKDLLASDPEFQREYEKMSPAEREQINQLTQELETISKDPKKLAEFEKNLERTMRDMDEALNKIGGEDALNNMTEDELTDFIMNFTAEQDAKYKKQKTQKKSVPQKPQPKTSLSPSTANDKEILLENIKTIIQHIGLFLVKTTSMHELPEKIESWSHTGLLPEWGKTATWNTIKNHIELLQSKLTYITSVNPTTQKRPYLDYIYEDKALMSLIQLLKTKLVEYEPKITVTSFEIGNQLSRTENQAVKATQQLINSLGDALQKLTINTSINKAIEKYEPLAKEMREAEEKFLKIAEAEAKKKPTVAKSIPRKHTPHSVGTAGYKPDQSRGGYYPSSSSYNSPYTSRQRSSRSHPSYDDYTSGSQDAGSAGQARPNTEKETKEKKDTKTTPTEEDKKINKLLNNFEGEMENVAEINLKESVASTLTSSKTTQPPKRLTLKTESALKEMTGSLKTATTIANDLYNNVDNPQSYTQSLQAAMRPITPFMNAVEKLYNADFYDAQIEKARAHSFPVEDAWKMAKNKKIVADKELAELSMMVPAAAPATLQAAQRNVDDAQLEVDRTKMAWEQENALVVAAQAEKEIAIPADVSNMLAEYKKLQRQTARFTKKPRRRPISQSAQAKSSPKSEPVAA